MDWVLFNLCLTESWSDNDADIEFEYYAGDHFTLFTEEYKKDGTNFLLKDYKNWLNENK
ncbi:hypothetical protein [Gaetbulibacter saemankumensis]|uniref:hypothetical protein n=1 Tax=Gaetbulibacter saemankumensis TaxID=311208 RepID=UPI0003F90BE8|nr:hypothetical protein [Gaetbulibacter saemankumensis]